MVVVLPTRKAAWRLWYMPVKSLKISVWKMNIPCWLPVLCRKKTATVCAGSTLLNNPAFARNLWSVPNQPTARYTVVNAVVWKFVLMFRVLAATVRHQNAVITPFSKWVRFLANYKNSPNVWVMTNSSAKAPSPFLKSSSPPQAVALSQTAAQFQSTVV